MLANGRGEQGQDIHRLDTAGWLIEPATGIFDTLTWHISVPTVAMSEAVPYHAIAIGIDSIR